MRSACRRELDVCIVWRFDRFARSVKHFVLALEEFQCLSTGFVSCQEALDTSTPMGKAMFTIVGAMAEREEMLYASEFAPASGMPSGMGSSLVGST